MSESTPLIEDPTPGQRSLMQTVNVATVKTLKSSPVNWLLIFVPIGILSEKLDFKPSLIFMTNFMAIIPLASLLAFATEELGESINNNSVAGLLNATFGNAVEVIVSIIALRQNQITVVQSSMIGSILSNLLLVLGSCFVVGGLKFREQFFNQTAAQTMGSLLAVSVMSLLLPAAFHASIPQNSKHSDAEILSFSRGTSIILLFVYVLYMVFQLRSHAYLFADSNDHSVNPSADIEAPFNTEDDINNSNLPTLSNQRSHSSNFINRPKSIYDVDMLGEIHLNYIESLVVLILSTVLVSVCADNLVSTIDDIVQSSGLSKTFIGLIVIPIVGNAAEHVTAIYVAYKNKMDLAIGVAIGSSLQIALFVTPLLVLVGWVMDVSMSLYFSVYQTAVIFVSVFITNSLILDGSSNWLEGAMLVAAYFVIAISFYQFPDVNWWREWQNQKKKPKKHVTQ